MTETGHLRKLLDKRGVEWGNIREDGSESDYLTEWQIDGNFGKAIATEWAVGGGLSIEIHRHNLTPEQAVEATLGRGECHPVAFGMCSRCGAMLDGVYGSYCPNCGRKVVGE